jgi:hypothetical protein
MDVVISDSNAPGNETARMLLTEVPSPITLSEFIRFRVREEVARFNAAPKSVFNGLVQPHHAEVTLNGYEFKQLRQIDWVAQADAAVDAFTRNRFFVFVADRQIDDLQAELSLADADVVRFVKLVPLVGG